MKKNFIVSGMTCSACSARVERCITAIGGVKSCAVNLITGAVSVEMVNDVTSEITSAVIKEGYGIKEGASMRRSREREVALKRRLILSVPLMLILMYVAMGAMLNLPVPNILNAETSEGMIISPVVQAVLALAVIIINFDYYKVGFKKLVKLSPNMDSLVALGSSASFLYAAFSVVMIAVGKYTQNDSLMSEYMHNLYFEGSAMILTLITVGKFLEEKSKNKTMGAVEKLLGLAPDVATVLVDGEEKVIAASELKVGDMVVLKDGDRVPCDGIIENGGGWIDQSAITGESIPVYKEVGEKLVTGTVFSGGYAVIKTESVGEDTTLYKIVQLVEDANSTKVPIARLADKVAGVFVPVVIAIALTAFAVWLIIGANVSFAVNIAVSVLVVSCPCALGLATPAALMAGTGKAAENGILIKSGEALQKTASVDAIVLDKTGTITYGSPKAGNVVCADGVSREEFLSYCASLEKKSSHVLGKPVIELAQKENVDILPVEDFETVKGSGICGVVNGKKAYFGNLRFSRSVCGGGDGKLVALAEKEFGATVLYLVIENKMSGYISIKDEIKPSSREAVAELKSMGKQIVMLTGDNASAAKEVADELGIEYEAEVLPNTKYEAVNKLKAEGKNVMMVGDGVNDAPALSAADIGAAIGAGTDIAIDSADVVLIKNDLTDVAKCIKLGSKVMLNIKENLFWAFFYNVILIPIACGVLYVPFGIKLNPMYASLAMSLSSVCVVCNALRLRFIKFKQSATDATLSVLAVSKTETPNMQKQTEFEKKGEDKMNKTIVYIEGMMCEHCKKRVESVLEDLGLKAEVDLKEKRAVINGEVDEIALKEAVVGAGYEVVSIEK